MDRIYTSVIAMIVFATAAFGLGMPAGQPQQADVLRTGFVVVSPIIGTGDGLMLFERLTNRVGDRDFESTVWPSAFVTSTALVVSSDSLANHNTGVVLVNPGRFPANITLTLRNESGSIVASTPLTLEPLHHISRFVGELFTGQPSIGVTGLLSVTSTNPIVVTGLLFHGAEFSLLPTTATGIFGFPANLVIPQFAAGGGWSSEIIIANRVGTAQVVRVDFHDSEGQVLARVENVNIPASGIVVVSSGTVFRR